MYTSYIGQQFLALYNRKTGASLSAEEFFDQVMFPLFFDSEKHLMQVHNSSFMQKIGKDDLDKIQDANTSLHYFKLQRLKKNIHEGVVTGLSAAEYTGYSAARLDSNTSGQVTSFTPTIEKDEVYASWIGNALAIRVEKGQCLLVNSETILWHLYEGWTTYRRYLSQVPQEGRQIETWNGHWLVLGTDENSISPVEKLEPYKWMQILLKLSQFHPNEVLPVYVFLFSKINTTVGFVNFHLPQVSSMSKLKDKLTELRDRSIRKIWEDYEGEYSLVEAIRLFGEIGLQALKPKDFAKLLEDKLESSKVTDKNKMKLSICKLWIIAMLNNKNDLQALAAELARALYEVETQDKRLTSTNANLVKAVHEATSLRMFINAITDLIDKNNQIADSAYHAVSACLQISADYFPLFKSLLRLEYVYLKAKS